MRCRFQYAVLLLAVAGLLPAQTANSGFTFPSAQAGQNATVMGTGLDAVKTVSLQQPGKTTNATIVASTATSLTFTIPADTAPGTYSVVLAPGGQIAPTLTVVAAPAPALAPAPAPAPAAPPTVVESVFPTAPSPAQNRFDFEINGSGFSAMPALNKVNVDGQGDIPFKHSEVPDGCKQYLTKPEELPCVEAAPDGRRLSIFGFERRYAYQGPIKVKVLVNGSQSAFYSFTLSRVNRRIIVWLTFVIFALLMYTVYRLVARGIQPYIIAGQKFSPLAAFLLDKETNSYSLSKFQFFAFSLVLFFAYIYVLLCRTLVQWQFSFPDIPDNYPSLLAISAGTTAAAAGLTSVRGTKGAGPVLPSAADFVCNGGLVVADRFQFFVWTLVGCLGFIALVLMQDPATVTQFPTFPQGLLYVMGVSAAGYLGGKAVRNPGPVLKEVKDVKVAANGLDLSIKLIGANLDKKAKFRIDGAEQTPAGAVTGTSQAGAPQDYCSDLSFDLVRAAGFSKGDHTFEIVNADGLGAQLPFTGNPMIVTKPPALTAGATAVTVPVTITDCRDGSTARWQAPGAPAPQDLPKPQFTPPNTVTVNLIPGIQKGSGTLTFTTPGGATETTAVDVQ